MPPAITPTKREILWPQDEVIVSKTDVKGRITYANRTFCRVCGYSETELLGAPHSIIRHPDMPRAAFKLLWDTLFEGHEVFAYVKNLAKSGDFYWVLAHVTPTFDAHGKIVGFHSHRRVPDRRVVAIIEPIYALVLAEERKHKNGQQELAAGFSFLVNFVKSKGMPYDELVFSL